MLLIKFLIYFHNFFIAQAAVMKITNLPLTDHLRSQKQNNQYLYNDVDSKNKHKIKREYKMPDIMEPMCSEPVKPNNTDGRKECEPTPLDLKVYIATHHNGDAYIERKSEKERQLLQQTGGRVRMPAKRESVSNLTTNGNLSSNSSTDNSEVDHSFDKVASLLHPDMDSYYDSELIRKLSDINGKLPTSLKLVIPPDKEPIVVYNESDDDSFRSRNFMKREAMTPKSNIYYDYNYYEDQPSVNSQLNSGLYNIRKKYSNERQFFTEKSRSSNNSVEDSIKEINKLNAPDNDTESAASTLGIETLLSLEPITVGQERKEKVEKNGSRMFQITDNFDNDINIVAKRKGTCPPPEAPGKQGCHPVGNGLPKNPIMPSLIKNGKDPEYEKLMKGETSERVIKTIVEKIHKNPSMAVELGICDFDLAEMRNMFRKMRNRDKKDCCSKLSGEFKCFLTWLLTLEPSRKKRAEVMQEETSKQFQTCNQFPKFDLMGGECYRKPSPQYEKLVQRVEEYRDENNVK